MKLIDLLYTLDPGDLIRLCDAEGTKLLHDDLDIPVYATPKECRDLTVRELDYGRASLGYPILVIYLEA